MGKNKIKFAPRKIFEQILEWAVIPAFDLVIEYGDKGVILVKRKLPPYKNVWALPGLRIYKGENIEDTIRRIAKQELGLKIDPRKRIYLGQYVAKFTTEHNRQDISTGFLIKISGKEKIVLNSEHFSGWQITKNIPQNTGAMYKFYLNQYKKINRR